MATATIRPARPADAPLLPAIERSAGEAFRTLPGLAWIADDAVMAEEDHRRWIAAGTSWVADEGGGPIGFLVAEDAGDALHIWEVAVRADQQGRGIGRQLFEAAADHGRTRGREALTLTTFRDVRWNEPFYLRLGFETLAPQAVDERLQAILAREAEAGLPASRRCAMRRALRS